MYPKPMLGSWRDGRAWFNPSPGDEGAVPPQILPPPASGLSPPPLDEHGEQLGYLRVTCCPEWHRHRKTSTGGNSCLRACEVLTEVALRIAAGWTTLEIAAEFDKRPPAFKHVNTPSNSSRMWPAPASAISARS